jgi:hypothetical protein
VSVYIELGLFSHREPHEGGEETPESEGQEGQIAELSTREIMTVLTQGHFWSKCCFEKVLLAMGGDRLEAVQREAAALA